MMNNILSLIENFYKTHFISPSIVELLTILTFSALSTFVVLLAHISIYKLFKIDLIKIKSNIIPNWIYYFIGSTTTYIILYALNLISYNVQTIIVVAFTWRILLKNVVDNLTNKSDIENSVSEIDEALPMYSDDFE